MKDKSTNDLENIIVDLIIGPNPTAGALELEDKVNLFVTWCFNSNDIKKELREKHQLEWDIITIDPDRIFELDWVDHYNGFLIKKIRDMKLKSILNKSS